MTVIITTAFYLHSFALKYTHFFKSSQNVEALLSPFIYSGDWDRQCPRFEVGGLELGSSQSPFHFLKIKTTANEEPG